MALGLVVVAAVAVLSLSQVSGIVARFGQGADRSRVLADDQRVTETLAASVRWDPDAAGAVRSIDPTTRKEVAATYARAWARLGTSLSVGEDIGLDDAFSGEALDGARRQLRAPRFAPVRLRQRGHRLRVDLMSRDGTTLAVSVRSALVDRQPVAADPTGFWTRTEETFDLVVTLDDGAWRIRQMRRTGVRVLPS